MRGLRVWILRDGRGTEGGGEAGVRSRGVGRAGEVRDGVVRAGRAEEVEEAEALLFEERLGTIKEL